MLCYTFDLSIHTFSSLLVTGKDLLDFNEQVPIIVRELLYRFNDGSPEVLKAAHGGFSALSEHVPAEELVNHIEFIRNLIASMVSEARRRKGGVGDAEFLLPGFNMPKGKRMLTARQRIDQNDDCIMQNRTRQYIFHGGND
jgi:hypothetical protein